MRKNGEGEVALMVNTENNSLIVMEMMNRRKFKWKGRTHIKI